MRRWINFIYHRNHNTNLNQKIKMQVTSIDPNVLPHLPIVVCVAMYRTNGALERCFYWTHRGQRSMALKPMSRICIPNSGTTNLIKCNFTHTVSKLTS